MQNNTLNISVVIATYNRSVSLIETMQALVQQDFHPARFEVIVVNDGSTDQTIEKLKEFKIGAPFQIRFFSQANRGPAAARNKGIMEAAGHIIAFTDDDCIPDPDWLTSIHRFFEKNNHVGLQGSTYTDVDKITPLTHQIDNVTGNPSVPTCNAAYLRSALLNANSKSTMATGCCSLATCSSSAKTTMATSNQRCGGSLQAKVLPCAIWVTVATVHWELRGRVLIRWKRVWMH
jgi:glycosyltransferase involved in cell wall biosynthesis